MLICLRMFINQEPELHKWLDVPFIPRTGDMIAWFTDDVVLEVFSVVYEVNAKRIEVSGHLSLPPDDVKETIEDLARTHGWTRGEPKDNQREAMVPETAQG